MSVTYQGLPAAEPFLRKCGLPYYDRITEVELTGGRYSDEVVPQLARLRRLQKLTLNATNISTEGLARLSAQLRHCKIDVNTNGLFAAAR